MEPINRFDIKSKLSKLHTRVEETGEGYVICRNGKPVAKLVDYEQKDRVSQDDSLAVKILNDIFISDMKDD